MSWCTVNSYAQEYNSGKEKGLILVSSDKSSISFRFTVDKPQIINRPAGNDDYYTVSLSGLQHSTLVGKPEIPVSTSLMDLSKIKIERIIISGLRIRRYYPGNIGFRGQMYPRQESLTKNQDPQDRPFRKDYRVYASDKPWVSDTVSIEQLGKIRGQSLALLKINPVIYYPASNYFDLIESMDIKIITSPLPFDSDIITESVHSSKGIVNKGLAYYDEDDVTPSFSLEPSGIIILSDTTMKKHLQPLVKWKSLKGFKVYELYVGENGLDRTFVSIKDTLNKIWNNSSESNPPPEFLIIGGGTDIIPASEGAAYLSDLYYSEFDGNGDFLPDMFSGRLPARDSSEMKAIVEKILQYEKFDFADTIDHYEDALLFAGWDAGHTSDMDGQLSYANNNYLNPSNGVNPYVFLSESNSVLRDAGYDSVATLLNKGVGFVNYTGHGSPTKWSDVEFSYSHAAVLNNVSRYPVIISNACETAAFDYDDNLGSAFVRGKEKGALAFIGCTQESYWDEDFWWSVGLSTVSSSPDYATSGPGIYDGLFHSNGEAPSDWFTSLGQIIYAGNLSVLSSPSSLKKYYWEYYTLLGDPSLMPYIGTPDEFNISLPDSIPSTLRTLSFVTLPFSYTAVSDFDTLWDAASISPSGTAYLTIPDVAKDSCLLIVTGQNKVPFIKTLYFNNPDTAYLSINDINPNDDSGNGNGLADFSETISFDIDIQNAGNQSATSAYIILSSENDYITIIEDSVGIGTVAELNEVTVTNSFIVLVDENIPDKEIVSSNLKLVYGNNIINQAFDFSIHSPNPEIVSWEIDDSSLGNANMRPEAGEQFDIILRVSNSGSSACTGSVNLTSLSSYILIDTGTKPSGVINPGDTIFLVFGATMLSNAPEGTTNNLNIEIDCDPYNDEKDIIIISGLLTEDFEHENFKTFPWLNTYDNPWVISQESPYRNSLSASSGNSGLASSSSELAIILNLPERDTLRFWYKVSSEADYDYLRFYVGDSLKLTESGDVDWKLAKIIIYPGVHKLVWQYQKDGSVSEGYDRAWIDFIRFPSISFMNKDLGLSKIITPAEPTKNYGFEPISVEAVNLGRDTLETYSLSYQVNNGVIVSESFSKEIASGDTAILSFTQFADLDEPGDYTIKIFRTIPDDYIGNDTIYLQVISTGIQDIISNSSDFRIGPNPFSDFTNLEVIDYTGKLRLSLISSNASVVWSNSYASVALGMRIIIPGNNMAKGIYYLRLDGDKKSYLYKLIIQ